LRAFYAYLIKRHGFTSNPVADIHSPKADKPLPVYVRQNEMAAILADDYDAADFTEVRNRLIILMFYSTGMRTTELETLLDTNVNTQRGELKVLGKRNKERIIPFGDELSEMITLYRQLRNTTVGGAPTNEFFVRPDGQPLYRQLIYRVVHSALQGRTVAPRQSPPRVAPHICRRYAQQRCRPILRATAAWAQIIRNNTGVHTYHLPRT